ncbi:MAG: YicC/YloC family endoribonuclease [Pseudomonadota bacterium]
MTAFGTAQGSEGASIWAWEIRSVNGRGLDVRVRLPEGFDALEPPLRKALGAVAKRGTITAGLKLRRRVETAGAALNGDALAQVAAALSQVQRALVDAGADVTAVDPAAVLALPGVYDRSESEDDPAALIPALTHSLKAAVSGFAEARAAEGRVLKGILTDQVDRIEALISEARTILPGRDARAGEVLRANVAKVLSDALDADRLAQELALLAVKSDVAEELDRLAAHITAARALLADQGPMGRKFDFLTQEFNREANTLCSKAGYEPLTRIGLDLKTTIDQMREQVQNVE